MRVLFFHNSYQRQGGEDVLVENEIALLRSRGNAVSLAGMSNNLIAGVVDKVRTAVSLAGSRTSQAWCETEIAAFQPDIVHVHNTFPMITTSVYEACRLHGVPVVQSLHNYRMFCANGLFLREGRSCELCLNASPYRAVRHACYHGSRLATATVARMIHSQAKRGTYDQVDCFVVSNLFTKQKFVAGGVDGSRIVVRPQVIMAEPSPESVRDRYALYVGRLSAEKGAELVVRAWSDIGMPLRIVGSGPLEGSLRKLAGPDVEVLGRVTEEEKMSQMAKASFLVIPSLCYENCPMVVSEAYGRSLPILASRLGSLELAILHEKTGLHFAAGDVEELRAQARRLAGDHELLKRLTLGARAYYDEHLQPEQIYAKTQRLYRNVIQSYSAEGAKRKIHRLGAGHGPGFPTLSATPD